MAHPITERNRKRGASKLKTALVIDVVSEVLLVAGIVLVLNGAGISNFATLSPCNFNFCAYLRLTPNFSYGIGSLIASSVGFLWLLFTLRSDRRTPIPQGEASN